MVISAHLWDYNTSNTVRFIRSVNSMSIIKVKFFARIREEMGRAEDQVEFRPGLKVSDIWNRASGDDEMPEAMLVAVNMEHVKGDPELKEGDEVAFFPPVTGG